MRKRDLRRKYKWAKLSDYVGKDIHCNEVDCSEVKTEQKISRKGNPYTSNLIRINFFDDQRMLNFAWFVQVFDKYENNALEVQYGDDLFELVSILYGDQNRGGCGNDTFYFISDYNILRGIIRAIEDAHFVVHSEKTRSGYVKYLPKFCDGIGLASCIGYGGE